MRIQRFRLGVYYEQEAEIGTLDREPQPIVQLSTILKYLNDTRRSYLPWDIMGSFHICQLSRPTVHVLSKFESG